MGLIYSCKKTDDEINPEPVSYKLPWHTQYLNYKNLACGSQANAYNIFYKDSLINEKCVDYSVNHISKTVTVNDSILHYFIDLGITSRTLTTSSGGYTWKEYNTAASNLIKFYVFNEELSYCITSVNNNSYVTGIGQSQLKMYHDSLSFGTHYITDLGTAIQNIDSTIIELSDTVTYIIKFHD